MRVFEVGRRWNPSTPVSALKELTPERIREYDEAERPYLDALARVSLPTPSPSNTEMVTIVCYYRRRDSSIYCADCGLWLVSCGLLRHHLAGIELKTLATCGTDTSSSEQRRQLIEWLRRTASDRARKNYARALELNAEANKLFTAEGIDALFCHHAVLELSSLGSANEH